MITERIMEELWQSGLDVELVDEGANQFTIMDTDPEYLGHDMIRDIVDDFGGSIIDEYEEYAVYYFVVRI